MTEGPTDKEITAEQELFVSALEHFEDFLKHLIGLENVLRSLPNQQRRVLLARLENRIAGKMLEKKYSSSSVVDLLAKAIESVTEIRGMLSGELPIASHLAPEDKES